MAQTSPALSTATLIEINVLQCSVGKSRPAQTNRLQKKSDACGKVVYVPWHRTGT
jgi:hypothetical protein